MYLGEPDGKSAGGMLFKFNVKTGETKILMSKSTGIEGGKGIIPTFRSAFKMNGKLYFEGMIMDTNNKELTQQEIQTAMAYQNGFPCVYEVDPENGDKLTRVYDSVDVNGFRSLVNGNVFTSTRAIGSFGNTLIAGDLKPTADGKGKAQLVASNTPSDPNSYKVIADMASFDNLPAIHRQDVNGGGIYQVQEFNGKLYVVICSGDTSTLNEKTGTMRSFAIYVGENNGDPTNKADWTWRPLVGDTAKGAKYYYGLDKSRVSAGACTLQVYGDYLYIGDYNDVSSALQGFVTKSNFVTQATNLEQSVNLYRMNKNENVEMLVGDANSTFPNGGTTGLGSGYDNHMNQYTWQTTVHEGKMYLSTMNTTTLLEPVAQFTNGDILNMSEKDWNNTVRYLRVFLRLLWGMGPTDPASAVSTQSADDQASKSMPSTDDPEALVDWARSEAAKDASVAQPQSADADSSASAEAIILTKAQTKELVDGIKDGSIVPGSLASTSDIAQLFDINNELESLPIPTIAAVGGFAFGGGCEMTLACDFRVGGSRTMLSFPEVGLGIIPGANGCARATAIVGPAKAKQLVMLTEMIPGKQAYNLGLLNWYVEGNVELNAAASEAKKAFKAAKKSGEGNIDALKAAQKAAEGEAAKAEYEAIYAKAVEVANTLKSKPGCALASAKAAINKAAIETVAAGKAAETTEFTLLFNTHDQKEGMAAMIEKRQAVFTNN